MSIIFAEIFLLGGAFNDYILHVNLPHATVELLAGSVVAIWLCGVVAGIAMATVRFEVEIETP